MRGKSCSFDRLLPLRPLGRMVPLLSEKEKKREKKCTRISLGEGKNPSESMGWHPFIPDKGLRKNSQERKSAANWVWGPRARSVKEKIRKKTRILKGESNKGRGRRDGLISSKGRARRCRYYSAFLGLERRKRKKKNVPKRNHKW